VQSFSPTTLTDGDIDLNSRSTTTTRFSSFSSPIANDNRLQQDTAAALLSVLHHLTIFSGAFVACSMRAAGFVYLTHQISVECPTSSTRPSVPLNTTYRTRTAPCRALVLLAHVQCSMLKSDCVDNHKLLPNIARSSSCKIAAPCEHETLPLGNCIRLFLKKQQL
jgi:hypothetical protein